MTILYYENNDSHNIHDLVKNNQWNLIKFYLYDLISKLVITIWKHDIINIEIIHDSGIIDCYWLQ